jgi:hypothetical protein
VFFRKRKAKPKKSFTLAQIDAHLAGFTVLDERPRTMNKNFETALRESDLVVVEDFEINAKRFEQYCERVDYRKTYPKYYKEFGAENVWTRKQLEHFISFEVTHPASGSMFMDVAASGSPVTNILRNHFNVATAYKQDLSYPKGVHKDIVGSNACEIPLGDAYLDAVLAHNSWEHFEGDSDRGFLVEAGRILKPGGTLCIIPFDFGNNAYQITSPSVWHNKYINAPNMPELDTRCAVVVDESIKQRLIKCHSPETFLEDIEGIPDLEFTFSIITNCGDYRFQRHFLTAKKRA